MPLLCKQGVTRSSPGPRPGLQEALDPAQDLWLIDSVGEAGSGAVLVEHERVYRQDGGSVEHRAPRVTEAQPTSMRLSRVARELQVKSRRIPALQTNQLDCGLQPPHLGDLGRPGVLDAVADDGEQL